MPYPHLPSTQRVRVFLSSSALLSLTSIWKAGALAIAELGVAAFFLIGPLHAMLGPAAAWFILAACVLSAAVRLVDVQSWSLFVPGGLIGRLDRAFGPRAGLVGASASFVERLLLAALSSVVLGRYVSVLVSGPIADMRLMRSVSTEDTAALVAIALVGFVWLQSRRDLALSPTAAARGAWIGIGVLGITSVWGLASVGRSGGGMDASGIWPLGLPRDALSVLGYLFGLGLALPAIGGGEALTRLAHEFPLPRDRMLRRTTVAVAAFALAGVAIPAFVFVAIIPGSERALWIDAPLIGLVRHLAGPRWLLAAMSAAIVAAAGLVLAPAVHAAMMDAAHLVRRLAAERVLPGDLASIHPRFGTPARALDVSAAVIALTIVLAGSQVSWLARGYAVSVAFLFLLKVGALAALAGPRGSSSALAAPVARSRAGWIAGTVGAVLIGAAGLALLLGRDLPSISAGVIIALVALALAASNRRSAPVVPADELDVFELLPSADLSRGGIDVRPGNLLVPVRNRYSLAHLDAALGAAGDRDVVVMTVRTLSGDMDDASSQSTDPTADEREIFSRVAARAERHGRPVRLLIVPAENVFDAVMSSVLRLRSAEVYVGESASLSAGDQARLAGEAWERAEKSDGFNVRLVIVHSSGRIDAYHMGAHPPALTPGDLDLIHRLWLDVAKAVGPHVHHDDVVRAALMHMEQQLTGPERDDALAAVRQVARPAEELAAALHGRDFSRLRDITRNRHGHDLAALLSELGVEDQVVAFRLLPRKDAAALFEYLTREDQEALLKAMAQEDVAKLLTDMAPDDRTMFLEELPAPATRQLLSLLTPAERAVAMTLLGYPESSVGRLMTPHYVAVREDWTVRQVLDYIREHGQDSETLNVVYVVDEQGVLIDDIRIRELLLTSPDNRVADLMDRRFVALKATDDQETAVAMFRQYDRTALPVTDTAGVLIGIVTVDDVLDVVEATTTKEIQRIGGSEALDEPYMEIAFVSMIRKRAGWLTALFLGEMLTATAMAAFEADISRAVVLALFVPLIISSGGNSGSQASTLVIRALALGELRLGDWWRVVRREMLAGLTLGAILGSIGFLRITVWSSFSNTYGEHWLLVAVTVSVALVGVVLWGTLVGSLLPFVLRRLGFDPATSSAPFVATLVDVTGLIIYFSVALTILRGTLL